MRVPRPNSSIARGSPVARQLALVIELQLCDSRPEIIKAGLQRACEQFEAGRLFMRPKPLTDAVRLHVFSSHVKIRRWAYKLAALVHDDALLPQLHERLQQEDDPENHSWAVAAFFGIASRREQRQLVTTLDQRFHQSALELAALLYVRDDRLEFSPAADLKTFENDPLAQRWLCILVGYSQHDTRMITRRFSDLDLVRNLVRHDDKEIIEYSIWAEHSHRGGSYRRVLAPLRDLAEEKSNIRRWVYRLVTKTDAAARDNGDIIVAGMHDSSVDAREGLALGLTGIKAEKLRMKMVDWFNREQELRVKLALVEHLGRTANDDHVFRDALIAEYARRDCDDLLAQKIDSVIDPRHLAEVRSMRDGERMPSLPLSSALAVYAPNSNFTVLMNMNQEINMTDKSIIIKGQSVSVGIVNAGVIRESIIHTLNQTRDQSLNTLADDIKRFATALEQEPALSDDDKTVALEQVQQATTPDAGDARPRRLKALATYVRGLLQAPQLATKFIEDGQKLIDAIVKVVS